MVQVTSDDVIGILKVYNGCSLTPFIKTALSIVNSLLVPCYPEDDPHLDVIALWLSAHFYEVMHGRITEEHVEMSEQHYETKVGLNLNLTRYGQQALSLDYCGKLTDLGVARLKAGVTWVGNKHDNCCWY